MNLPKTKGTKMTTINTAADARAIVLAAVENTGRDKILGEVVQWNNTTENDISADGNVWAANPQTGHWLNDDHLIEFATFLAAA